MAISPSFCLKLNTESVISSPEKRASADFKETPFYFHNFMVISSYE